MLRRVTQPPHIAGPLAVNNRGHWTHGTIIEATLQIPFKMKKAVFLLVILLSSISCEKTTRYDYQLIDSDIVISMSEELGNPTRSFKFGLQTDKAYPCINYSLITNSTTRTDKISIEVLGIYTPEVCLTAIGPASSAIPVTSIQNNTYDIEFKIGTNISTGKLICTSNEFKLQMNDLLQIKINGPVLKRVPVSTIWGTVGYHNSTSIDKVNEFISTIKTAGASELTLEDGNYNYFEIENGKIKEPTNSGYWFTKTFVYKFSGDKNLIRSIVKDYSKNFGDLMSISVHGDMGEEFLGWILKNE
mgnify:CR=1 FL=1